MECSLVTSQLRKLTMLAALLSSVFVVDSSFAGGNFFPIKITELQVEENFFSLKAEILPGAKDAYIDDCGSIKIVGEYDKARWEKYTKLINVDIHKQAIAILSAAFKNGKAVNFGYISQGLKKTEECSFLSKGLFFDSKGVHSIHSSL